MLGQQQHQQQMAAHQIVVNCYLSLIPVVAGTVLQRTDVYADREQLPEQIADEAWRIAAASVKKIGIQVSDQKPEAKSEPSADKAS
jgi:hypothetical protein